jgi:hypothetical protein
VAASQERASEIITAVRLRAKHYFKFTARVNLGETMPENVL